MEEQHSSDTEMNIYKGLRSDQLFLVFAQPSSSDQRPSKDCLYRRTAFRCWHTEYGVYRPAIHSCCTIDEDVEGDCCR